MKIREGLILAVVFVLTCSQCYSQFSFRRTDADLIYKEAIKLSKQKKYSEATELSNKILRANPDYTDAKVLLTRIYIETNKTARAREMILSVIATHPQYYDAWLISINLSLKLSRIDDALCYADEGLKYFPGDIDLLLKKLTILALKHNYVQGNEIADELYKKYNTLERVKLAYTDYYYNQGQYFKKLNNSDQAKRSLDKATVAAPENKEVSGALIKLEEKNRDMNPVLNRVNSSLEANPRSYTLLMQKLGELQETKRYPEALEVLKQVLTYYPSDVKARRLETELRMEAARYYTNMDPYALYESVLEKDPGNRQALEKVIGMSLDRGEFVRARGYINNGLKKNPLDLYLLARKTDLAEYDKRYQEAATAAGVLLILDPSEANRLRFSELKVLSGQQLLSQQQPAEAEKEFEDALRGNPSSAAAIDGLVACYTLRKDYKQAVTMLNRRLSAEPEDITLLTRKSGLLSEAGEDAEAAEIAGTLVKKNPQDKRLLLNYQEIALTAARNYIRKEEYSEALQLLADVLEHGPVKDGYNYMINTLSLTKNYEGALAYTSQALTAYPDDKEFLLKRVSVLNEMARFDESVPLMTALVKRYPYNTPVRSSLVSSLLMFGKSYEKRGMPDSALSRYSEALSLNPKDTLGLIYYSNLLAVQKLPDSALSVISKALTYYPLSRTFLWKRVVILEELGRYEAASATADSLADVVPIPLYRDYAGLLRSKSLKNQFGLFYLHSSFESPDSSAAWPSTQIATIEYRRFNKKGSWAARINYTSRAKGTGIQGEGEIYCTHNARLYSFAALAMSNDLVFPKYRIAYSLYRTFKEDIELEGGFRFLSIDSSKIYSPVVSIAKTAGDFWLNFRVYGIWEARKFYQTYNFTTRYYLNGQKEFLSLVAAAGTSPDDRSRLIEFPRLAGLLSRSAGVGYQKTIAYRNTLSAQFTWINQKITPAAYRNQYDVYLTFQRKF